MNLGILMDPIGSIKIEKDTSFAFLLEAQFRGYIIHYFEQSDLFLKDGIPYCHAQLLTVTDRSAQWFEFLESKTIPLSSLDIILMRKDPPFDMEYIYDTYLLELAYKQGVMIINKPSALRDINEKAFIAWFPDCCPSTLISKNANDIRAFVESAGNVVIKPLDGMGGQSIFKTHAQDPNLNVIIETVSELGQKRVMCQVYVDEISAGDKRVLLINGKPVDYALARIPSASDFRGNLAKGGTGKGVALSDRDRWICEQVGPELRKRGVLFAGLDIIGDYLTEINVTSPTCVRELDSQYNLNISALLFDQIETLTNQKPTIETH